MAIKKDHSALPSTPQRNWAPDTTPRFGPALAQAWAKELGVELDKPTRLDTKLRLSQAGACARSIGYFATRTPKSNPPTLSGYWRMGLGTMVHALMEPAITAAFPGAQTEVVVDFTEAADLSGSADVLMINDDGWKTLIEWKTINGFGFKMMVGARGTAEGPKTMHVAQAALAAYKYDCDELVIGYLSLECLSQREADKIGADDIGKFVAEFTLHREEYEPIAMSEHKRQRRINDMVVKGELPPRQIGELGLIARVTDPATGAWQELVNGELVGAGTTWMCGYCDYQDRCVQDGPS